MYDHSGSERNGADSERSEIDGDSHFTPPHLTHPKSEDGSLRQEQQSESSHVSFGRSAYLHQSSETHPAYDGQDEVGDESSDEDDNDDNDEDDVDGADLSDNDLFAPGLGGHATATSISRVRFLRCLGCAC